MNKATRPQFVSNPRRAAERAIMMQLLLTIHVVGMFFYLATASEQSPKVTAQNEAVISPLPSAKSLLGCLLEAELVCPYLIIAMMIYGTYVARRGPTAYFHLLAISSAYILLGQFYFAIYWAEIHDLARLMFLPVTAVALAYGTMVRHRLKQMAKDFGKVAGDAIVGAPPPNPENHVDIIAVQSGGVSFPPNIQG